MATKEFFVLDTENRGIGGKMNGDKVLKQQSLGGNNRLSDITNSLSSPNQDVKQKLVGSCSERDHIEHLLKENVALRKLIAERNKYSAMAGIEIKKMRETMQKLQQQNWHLAQANSKMLMEVNIGKDRLKAMQHELGCRSAMVKSLQLQETENEPCQNAQIEEVDKKLVGVKGRRQSRIHSVESSAVMDEVAMESKVEVKGPSNSNRRRQSRVHSVESSAVMDAVVIKDKAEVKGPSNSNRRRQSRIHSVESSAVTEEVVTKDKADDKRHSAVSKSEQTEANEEKTGNKRRCLRRKSSAFTPEVPDEPTDEKAESKRRCLRRKSSAFTPDVPEEPTDEKAESKRVQLRRHSTRLKPQQPEPAEDLFEIEDAKFPVCLLIDEPVNGSGATSSDSTTAKKAKKGTSAFMVETPEPRRASVGRPVRSAAVKVQCYKEVPLNIKMRRP